MYANLKPMRAFKLSDDKLDLIQYPCYASPKFDGIRAIVFRGFVLSNTLKPIRNPSIQQALAHLEYFDGELIAGKNFQETTSCVMSTAGGDDFTFYAFDSFKNPKAIFINRLKDLEEDYLAENADGRVKIVQHIKIKSPMELLAYEEAMLQSGYEGIMLRHPRGLYKFGRSTFNEEALLKRKPVCDEEAFIIGFEEQEENLNELTYDNRGYAQRSMHQDNKAGKDTLGAFIVRSSKWGDFKIGTGLGLTDILRKDIWLNRNKYLGQIITFKYQAFGSKDKPRQPIFLRFRHADDVLTDL
jgi:DNA ligase-1